ncbi:hypothetical protein LJC07_04700 [Christensenellaceae bacterium OttesenSCG-928-L17]|nr:hypothetical protein [Christensenellaceae bacterium OttesenSCG-928-L17]
MATIKAKPNKDGRIEIELYGKKFDVTEMIKDGKATIEAFGQKYDVELEAPKTRKTKSQQRREKASEAPIEEPQS